MFQNDYDSNTRRDLLTSKRQAIGPIIPDRGVDLSEEDFLLCEIAELKEARRTYALPLIGIGLMITAFSFASATWFPRIFGFVFGLTSVVSGIYVFSKKSSEIKKLKDRLQTLRATQTSDPASGTSN